MSKKTQTPNAADRSTAIKSNLILIDHDLAATVARVLGGKAKQLTPLQMLAVEQAVAGWRSTVSGVGARVSNPNQDESIQLQTARHNARLRHAWFWFVIYARDVDLCPIGVIAEAFAPNANMDCRCANKMDNLLRCADLWIRLRKWVDVVQGVAK